MKLKRDISSSSPPASNQIEVGELVMNSNTGIIYSKRVDGTVIKWVPSQLCDITYGNSMSALPVISFKDINVLCCNGGAITITVDNLIYNNRYRLTITDLNTAANVVASSYSMELLPINSSQRSVALNFNIPSETVTAILKISISQIVTVSNVESDVLLSESILNTTCKNC
jgi:hypothetical protein